MNSFTLLNSLLEPWSQKVLEDDQPASGFLLIIYLEQLKQDREFHFIPNHTQTKYLIISKLNTQL